MILLRYLLKKELSKEGVQDIMITMDELKAWCNPRKNTLIAHLLGMKVHLKFLENRLKKFWFKVRDVRWWIFQMAIIWFTLT